ncbi:uncharacterized protein LOC112588707 isoform X1 [Harpegnathos saltator]|uniref:uncharacterized protein LOC112588707 isoform X1 n=1 Tax=Harpegnathos saltator TaxID=610380 RepID=UPI000DBED166|nr:uncharacterized protein LOC112588707 isoform X1 [Harpegnathos saltator]
MDHLYCHKMYTDSEDIQDISVMEVASDLVFNSIHTTELNTEADATFIDIVRGYPHLYAKNLKDFKDKNVRERSWEEIASVLNCSVEDCQRRWLRLREKFAKERKLRDAETKSGSGSITGRKEWALYQNMMFLSKHVQSRKTYTNLQSATQRPVIKAHPVSSCISSTQNP